MTNNLLEESVESTENSPGGAHVEIRFIFAHVLLLLLGLYINRRLGNAFPRLWILIPLLIAAALARARFGGTEKILVRLWQWIGCLSAVCCLLHYPLMPLARADLFHESVYAGLLVAWLVSIFSGIFCFRVPSLAILPPAFLLWSNSVAGTITGLHTTVHVDVLPLTEVSVCIGLGLLINQSHLRWGRDLWSSGSQKVYGPAEKSAANDAFAGLLLLIAIAVHLANYYWAFYTKMALDGPFGAWLTKNNPAYIFLAALDDGHILFSGYAHLVQWTYGVLNGTFLYANAWVLAVQAAVITAFFIPKRALLFLLLMLDVMHASIIVIAGADFWPWIVLNVIIAIVVVTQADLRLQPLAFRFAATFFLLVSPHFVQVTKLGWFDTGANNKLYFEAVDDTGKRYAVPTNFFTFYSYSFGHMDYGPPEPASAFATGEPNGGAWDYKLFEAGRRCDVGALTRPGAYEWFDREKLPAFIQNYHHLALAIHEHAGGFPYDVYPHHFYVPRGESEDFYRLDKRRIVEYVYRRESVCLSFHGAPQRKVVSSAEYRINVATEYNVAERERDVAASLR